MSLRRRRILRHLALLPEKDHSLVFIGFRLRCERAVVRVRVKGFLFRHACWYQEPVERRSDSVGRRVDFRSDFKLGLSHN